MSHIFGKAFVLSALVVFVSCFAFAGEAVHDEVWGRYLSPAERAVLTQMKNMPTDAPPADATPAELVAGARAGFVKMMQELAPPLPGQITEAYSQGGVSGLWIRPHDADRRQVLLYLHGGGFVVGSADTGAGIAGYLAEEAEINAFSLDYPLAPENPYPAQLDNAQAAYQMLLDSGYLPQNIVVAGDSAGGNLTLSLLLRLRARKIALPAGAYLISPWVELTHSSPTHSLKKDVDVALSEEMLDGMAANYVGEESRSDPFVSPIHAGLRGLPPLLIQVGSFERLLDDSLAIARNAAMADVPVRVSVWPGYYHDFQMFFSQLEGARTALDEAADFLNEVLDGELLTDR